MNRPVTPQDAIQGHNGNGGYGWMGPKPPPGHGLHRYHFQVLALDSLLDIPPGSDRDTLLSAASGHVLGKGELVGLYQQKIEPPKK